MGFNDYIDEIKQKDPNSDYSKGLKERTASLFSDPIRPVQDPLLARYAQERTQGVSDMASVGLREASNIDREQSAVRKGALVAGGIVAGGIGAAGGLGGLTLLSNGSMVTAPAAIAGGVLGGSVGLGSGKLYDALTKSYSEREASKRLAEKTYPEMKDGKLAYAPEQNQFSYDPSLLNGGADMVDRRSTPENAGVPAPKPFDNEASGRILSDIHNAFASFKGADKNSMATFEAYAKAQGTTVDELKTRADALYEARNLGVPVKDTSSEGIKDAVKQVGELKNTLNANGILPTEFSSRLEGMEKGTPLGVALAKMKMEDIGKEYSKYSAFNKIDSQTGDYKGKGKVSSELMTELDTFRKVKTDLERGYLSTSEVIGKVGVDGKIEGGVLNQDGTGIDVKKANVLYDAKARDLELRTKETVIKHNKALTSKAEADALEAWRKQQPEAVANEKIKIQQELDGGFLTNAERAAKTEKLNLVNTELERTSRQREQAQKDVSSFIGNDPAKEQLLGKWTLTLFGGKRTGADIEAFNKAGIPYSLAHQYYLLYGKNLFNYSPISGAPSDAAE